MKLQSLSPIAIAAAAALFSACSTAAPAASFDLQSAVRTFVEHPTHCQALIDGRGGMRMDEHSNSKPQDAEATSAFLSILEAPNLSQPQRNSVSPMLVGKCRQKLAGK